MRPLLRIAWRNATSSVGRTAMMLVAVCLGVAFLSSALAMSNTMARNLSVLFSSQYTGVDVVVRGEVVAFGQRADLSTDVVDEIEGIEGVAATAGIVEGFAQPIAMDGSPLGSPQQPGRGRSWVSDPQLQSLPMLQGNGPTTADEVALDRTTAEKGGVAIGDSIQLATPNEVVTITVSGFVDVSSGTGSALSWLDPAEAQELLGQPGLVQEILVAGAEGVAPEELASDVAAHLDAGADVLTGAQAAEESRKKVEAVFGFFRVILLVFVGIGLLVCAFIVYNTFAVLTAQRTRQLATLRALGCGQGQVMTSTLAEGAVLGVIGSVLGVGVGWLGSALLTRIITAAGLGEFPDGVELSASVVLISLAVGVGVTLVGAYPSARTAGRSRPVAAMREVSGTSTAVSLGQILLGLFGFLVGVLLVGRGATTGYPDGLGDVAIGALALILGLVAWGRTMIVGIVATLAPGASRWGGLPGALAGRNSVRDPKRTTVTAGSLALGLTLVSSLAVLGASTKATLTDAADAGLTADVLVLPLIGQTPMPAVVTDQVRQTPGVAASTPILFDTALIESRPTFVSGVDPDDVSKVITLDMQSGSADTLGQGELLVARSVAQSRGLRVGDEVRAVFAASGPVERRIGGVFDDNVYAGYWLLAADDFEMLSGKSGVWYVYAKAESGTSPDQVRDAVATEIEGTANTQAMTYEQFTSYQDDLVDQALAGMYFMLLFAVIVAVVGVANTVALSVSERTREIGVLRAVGLPRPGVSRMIRLEAVMTCVAGAALGTIVGIFLGASLRLTLDNIGFTTLAVPWPTIVMIFVLASLSGVLAAYVPARRAANLDILDAIRAT